MTYDYHYDFTNDVELDLDKIYDKIKEGADYVWDKWDETIAAKGLDSNWGWVISPGLKAAYEHFKGKLEDQVKRLWDEFETFCEDVWEKVEEMAGSPFALMTMNAAYIKAASRIRDEKTVLNDLSFEVGKHWEGLAYDSYTHAAGEQLAAIAGVDDGISQAATACAEGAKQLRSIWRDVIDALLDVVDTILDGIKDATDAGQWVTFDAGPAIKVIGKALSAALRLWNQLDRYFDDNTTVNLSMWRQLNSGLDGLDANNEWPQISARDKSDIDDKGGWGQK